MGRTRTLLRTLHRWAGLATALFLAIAGLTGAVIAWDRELDTWLNPALFEARTPGTPLPAAELARRVEAAHPQWQVTLLPLHVEAGRTLTMGVAPRPDPATGRRVPLGFDQVMVDPVSAQVQGRRTWGEVSLAREQLMPFLYRLHYTLCLPDLWDIEAGLWFFGIVAIVWTLDCVVGLLLSFPQGLKPGAWRPAFLVRWRGRGSAVRHHDVHRAGGVWTWGALLVLAVSSVALNLHDEVMVPVVSLFSPVDPGPFGQRAPRPPAERVAPRVDHAGVVALAAEEGRRRGFVDPPGLVVHRGAFGLYSVDYYAGHGGRPGLGPPRVYFDDADGRVAGDRVPGAGSAGDLFMRLQFPLHSGRIAGVPGRVVVSLLGVLVAVLSVTGVVIWFLRARGRRWRSRVPSR